MVPCLLGSVNLGVGYSVHLCAFPGAVEVCVCVCPITAACVAPPRCLKLPSAWPGHQALQLRFRRAVLPKCCLFGLSVPSPPPWPCLLLVESHAGGDFPQLTAAQQPRPACSGLEPTWPQWPGLLGSLCWLSSAPGSQIWV